jgi:hypothetical protein
MDVKGEFSKFPESMRVEIESKRLEEMEVSKNDAKKGL